MAHGGVIRESVYSSASILRERFTAAQPFPHVVIDDFFTAEIARDLIRQFPRAQNASPNLYGAPGKKAFHRDLRRLGSAYRALDEYFASGDFLTWIGETTGIPGLVYDETNYGGGTHENFEGRDLRPHVDFNFHPVTRLHRRVNVIVYLNEGWQPGWGGSIALYRDPRDPSEKPPEYAPIFNRCIVFETSERSWHGFERIRLPEGEKHRSRKSISIYLYTRERPNDEVHREHTTFFVPRALPAHYAAGRLLTEDDEAELHELIDQRDRLIELYQAELGRMETDSAQAARLRMALSHAASHRALPALGYVYVADAAGLQPDGWAAGEVRFTIKAERTVRAFAVSIAVSETAGGSASFSVDVNGSRVAAFDSPPGHREFEMPLHIARGASAQVAITPSGSIRFFIEKLRFEHAEE